METDNSESKLIRNINSKVFIHNNGVECSPTQVRRMLIPYGLLSLDKFISDFNTSFKESVSLDTYVFRYQDDEKDWIDFSSELEWVTALHMCHTNQMALLKIQLIKKTIESKRRDATSNNRYSPYTTVRRDITPSNAHQVIPEILGLMNRFLPNLQQQQDSLVIPDSENGPHYGTVCDGCQIRDFVGKRYKCADCENFDLCEECYNNSDIRDQHYGGHHTFNPHILPKVPDANDENVNLQLLSQSFEKSLSTLNSNTPTTSAKIGRAHV